MASSSNAVRHTDRKEISESFRRFGVGDTTTSLLAIKVSSSPAVTFESVQQHLTEVIEGTAIDFSDENLDSLVDMARVRKIYKLNSGNDKTGLKASKDDVKAELSNGGNAADRKQVEAWVLASMALRGVS